MRVAMRSSNACCAEFRREGAEGVVAVEEELLPLAPAPEDRRLFGLKGGIARLGSKLGRERWAAGLLPGGGEG